MQLTRFGYKDTVVPMVHTLKTLFLSLVRKAIFKGSSVLVSYNGAGQASIMRRVVAVSKEVGMALEKNEAFQLVVAVKATAHIPGDIAEVGTYTGGSSRLIGEYKNPTKNLYLFDTFEGLPESTTEDDAHKWGKGKFYATFEQVSAYMAGIKNVFITKGLFPASAPVMVQCSQFSFVHLDVDLYQATKDSLEFFYPRMNKGAILISHDYPSSKGVKKAFDDFFADKPEPLIQLSGIQVMFVKL